MNGKELKKSMRKWKTTVVMTTAIISFKGVTRIKTVVFDLSESR